MLRCSGPRDSAPRDSVSKRLRLESCRNVSHPPGTKYRLTPVPVGISDWRQFHTGRASGTRQSRRVDRNRLSELHQRAWLQGVLRHGEAVVEHPHLCDLFDRVAGLVKDARIFIQHAL